MGKKTKKVLSMLLAGSLLLTAVPVSAKSVPVAQFDITGLTTEYMTNPIGIDTDSIRFGWQMTSNVIGTEQSAYQIEVYEEDTNDLVWDSGEVESGLSTGIACDEKLDERTAYRWEVTVWDEDGASVTEEAAFETGVTNQSKWKNADFIRLNSSPVAPIFRTEQDLEGSEITRARLYITALGAYEAYVNGERAGEWDENGEITYHHMNPGYGNKTVSLGYQTYDITPFLAEEEAIAVSVVAGNGWYSGMATTVSQPAIKALVVITYEDGSEQIFDTNTEDWCGTLSGGIVTNGVYYGEDYNAIIAEELGDFTQVGYDDSEWINAGNSTATAKLPQIVNEFDEQSASYVRILVEETGPAISGVNENFLQLMEVELLDADGTNVVRGIVPQASNTWSPNAQWSPDHLTDGDLGDSTDYGYTTTVLSYSGLVSMVHETPISLTFDLGEEVSFQTLKMYPRLTNASVSGTDCANYPKQYKVQISDNGKDWTDVGETYRVESLRNTKLFPVDGTMSTTTYPGTIRAQVGIPGRLIDVYDHTAVSAVLYSGTKANSSYPGGEIDVDVSFEAEDGEDIFEDGIVLEKGQTMVVNMGQNMTAVPNIQFEGEKGTVATLKFAEILNDGSSVGGGATQADGPKGSIYQKSLRGARSAVNYTFAGNGIETYQTSMSFFGYQYIQITATDEIVIYGLTSKAISSVTDQTGYIWTNNEAVNKLFSNITYGQLSNYYTTPTDCNQRDERLSWTGDTMTFAQTAVYNFDSVAFLNEMQDIYNENVMIKGYVPGVADDLNGFFSPWATGWSDVEIILPWVMYQQTGDISVITESWDEMVRYMNYLKQNERGKDQAPAFGNQNYGDWLAFQGTCIEVMNDYFYGYVNQLMAQMAEIIGEDAKAEQYRDKFEAIKEKFLQTHVEFENDELLIKSNVGDGNLHFMTWTDKKGVLEANSQTSLIWMLKLGFYDSEEMREAAEALLIENIKNENPNASSVRAKYAENTLATGFLGTYVITPLLTEIGYADVSYDLLLQDEQPSWLFEVESGATTMWERWNSYTPGIGFGDSEMNSFNHYSYGSVAEWMYRYMGGIAADTNNPGFKNVILQPTMDKGVQYNDQERIESVDVSYESYYGTIESKWESDNGKLVSYHVEIPANTTATLYLPVAKSAMEGFVALEGVAYEGREEHNGEMAAKIILASGGYDFVVENGKVTVSYAEGYMNEVPPVELPYEDVTENDWFYDGVYYNYVAKTMTGMDDTHFGPYGQLSRAQFALILYRMEGEPEVDTDKTFHDITGDEWYGQAVLWAAENGIVTGYQDGNYGPADNITREQMAVMMYRYAKYLGEDVSTIADFDTFNDAASVSSFASDAMGWAVGNGIITGKENGTVIDPQGNTARAEAAIIIQRFMQ